jgi:hypothetical protein
MAANAAAAIAARRPEFSADQGQVNFGDFTVGKLFTEGVVDGIGPGDDHKPARVFVQAVNDAEPLVPSPSCQSIAAMMEQRIDESTGGMTRGRMDNESGRFIEDEERFVLMDDFKRDIFRQMM